MNVPVKCECAHCQTNLEFDAEHDGTVITCPRCLRSTTLTVPRFRIASQPSKPKKNLRVWWPYAFCILVAVLMVAATMVYLFVYLKPNHPFSQSVAEVFPVVVASGLMICLGVIYFIPFMIGRNKRNSGAILALNIFLGWTFIGWVVALVWALCEDPPRKT